MSLRVAVAGVTNGLGHAIVSALLDSPNLEVILLTRISSSPTDISHFTSHGAIAKPVDYTSIPSLESALGGVDTVISTIFAHGESQPTLNLISAAKAAGVRRFAPSEFAMSRAADARLDLYEPKRQVWAALKDSGLEYTSFQNGIFMDYFTFGTPKRHEGPLKVFPYVVNIATGKAIVPGTGNEKVTFTTVVDIGRFVAAAVQLDGRWPEELGMEGETTTYNQVIRDIETVTGRKLDVEYMDVEAIKLALGASKGDLMQFFYYQVSQLLAEGSGTVTPTLNRLAPHVTVTSVKQLLAEYWTA